MALGSIAGGCTSNSTTSVCFRSAILLNLPFLQAPPLAYQTSSRTKRAEAVMAAALGAASRDMRVTLSLPVQEIVESDSLAPRRPRRRERDEETATQRSVETTAAEYAFQLGAGDDLDETLAYFCAHEDLSVSLQSSLRSTFSTLLDEDAAEQHRAMVRASAQQSEAAGAHARSWLGWHERTCEMSFQRGAMSPGEAADLLLRQAPPSVGFAEKFAALVARGGEAVDRLLQQQQKDAVAAGRALATMDQALTKLQLKHSKEMDAVLAEVETDGRGGGDDDVLTAAQQSNTERISQLVNKQLAETKALEDRCIGEVRRLKEKQRMAFHEQVDALHRELTPAAAPSPTSPAPQSSPAASRQPQPQHLKDPVLSQEVRIGSAQRKTQYRVHLVSGDVTDVIAPELSDGDLPQQRRHMEALYTNQLSAVVLPHISVSLTDLGGVGATPRVKRFVAACERSTEYHFPALRDQMETIAQLARRRAAGTSTAEPSQKQQLLQAQDAERDASPSEQGPDATDLLDYKCALLPGDVFVTRHSNLQGAHVVFNIVDASAATATESSSEASHVKVRALRCARKWSAVHAQSRRQDPVLDGLMQIVLAANRLGVQRIFVPALMSESHRIASAITKPLPPDTTRQIEGTMRAVRASLMQIHAEPEPNLTDIFFMVQEPAKSPFATDTGPSHMMRTCKSVFTGVF